MKPENIHIIETIIKNVLLSLYQGFGASVLMAVLFMFAYAYCKKHGVRETVKYWLRSFRDIAEFRRVFVFAFYTAMILFRTVLYRNVWTTPLGKVLGIWGIHNKKGELYTENIENIILFIPFMFLLLWAFHSKFFKNGVMRISDILFKPFAASFCFSLSIEFAQLFFKLGTFQISDLFFNTLGGMIGGAAYCLIYKYRHRHKKDFSQKDRRDCI